MSSGSYDPKSVEAEIYRFWEERGHFRAAPDRDRRPFCIMIPPPNVTGALHMGHALDDTLQDVLIRHKRMSGFNTLWMPGTDHAGIATQAVVEKRLKQEQGLTRHELGREGLVKKIWEWKEEYNTRIINQLRAIGASCDWTRTRFTLDEVCAKAVYETFFRLFKDGLIYRGLRLVNWDAALQTAVADDEIVHEKVKGSLWHIRYPLEGAAADVQVGGAGELGRDFLIVATTRPETMLGDTAVAVHPDDPRYQHLMGKHVVLPLLGRKIPIIPDGQLVSMEFGTGCVKVTPAHDPNDYAFSQRHPEARPINILTPDGKINANGGPYAGLDRYEARKKVVADLEAQGLLEKIEPYETDIGHSDRSKTPIEPMLSEQWFVKMDRLAELAMEAVRDGRVRFFPERYAKTYLDWLGEKRDWCISRQLWWGHRIPVWTKQMTWSEWLEWGGREQDAHCLDGWHEKETGYSVRVVDQAGVFRAPCELLFGGPVGEAAARQDRDEAWAALDEPLTWYVCVRDRGARIYDYSKREVIPWIEENGFVQDADVLDTWFSSALWPHSTLGWPDNYGRGDAGSNPSRSRDAADLSRDREGAVGDAHANPLPHGRGSEMRGSEMRGSEMRGSEMRGSEMRGSEMRGSGMRGSEIAGGTPALRDLDYFYPTDVLVTAREIITLWVARMVITGLYNIGRVPFQHVVIHPVIQDGQGKRMSKTAGNGVDPLDLIEMFGTDAMRFTLTQLAGETQDIRMPVKAVKLPDGRTVNSSDRFELGRNFCNKLWQAATGFVLPNIRGGNGAGAGDAGADEQARGSSAAVTARAAGPGLGGGAHEAGATQRGVGPGLAAGVRNGLRALTRGDLAVEDRWILSRLAACVAECDRRLARYQFQELANTLYAFFWSDFCDWYVELVKPRLYGDDSAPAADAGTAEVARRVLAWVLDQALRLLHPIVPFVTEALWRQLNEAAPQRGIDRLIAGEPALITAAWPVTGVAAAETTASAAPGAEMGSFTANARAGAAALWRDEQVEREIAALQDVIRALRDTLARINTSRSAAKQPAIGKLPHAVIRADAGIAAGLAAQRPVLERLGRCERVEVSADARKPPESATQVLRGVEVYVPLAGLMDLAAERARLTKERDELRGHSERLAGKLANEGFVAKAPAAVVEQERARLAEMQGRLETLERNLAELG